MNNSQVKILVVDDSDTARTQLKATLEKAGYQVIEAKDGLDGIRQVTASPDVALILADVNMPNMDGITMCVKIRQIQGLQAIPIVMLTTETNAQLKEQGKSNGVVAWITKPFHPEKTLAGISKLLSMQKKAA